MKTRATLLAFFALAFLALDAAAQPQPWQPRPGGGRARNQPATSALGSYERTKVLTKVRAKPEADALGSVQRRALLTTGKLAPVPKLYKKPGTRRSRR